MNKFTTLPLLSSEKYLLEDLLREERTSCRWNALYLFILAFILPFIPTRHHRHWPATREEYLHQVLFSILLLAAGFTVHYVIKIRQLRQDLVLSTKMSAQIEVRKKERSRSAGTFSIWLNTEESDFKSFHISQEEYEQIQIGQYVTLEYAQHSKYLFKTNWQSHHTA